MEKIEEGVLENRTSVIKTNKFIIIEILTWALILLAIFSCLWRNDCNVLIGLLLIFILNRKFILNPTLYSKILIHILIGVLLIDLIWMFMMFPYWNDDKNEIIYSDTVNTFHHWIEFFGILEFLIKIGLIAVIFTIYKTSGSISGLFNFKYS